MDQFLLLERLKILTRGGAKKRPKANSNGVALHLEKNSHKGNFQEQNDTCANMSSFTFQCGGSVCLGPDVSGSTDTNASI